MISDNFRHKLRCKTTATLLHLLTYFYLDELPNIENISVQVVEMALIRPRVHGQVKFPQFRKRYSHKFPRSDDTHIEGQVEDPQGGEMSDQTGFQAGHVLQREFISGMIYYVDTKFTKPISKSG